MIAILYTMSSTEHLLCTIYSTILSVQFFCDLYSMHPPNNYNNIDIETGGRPHRPDAQRCSFRKVMHEPASPYSSIDQRVWRIHVSDSQKVWGYNIKCFHSTMISKKINQLLITSVP
jgi:hypothetical protein